jgi:DNA-binding transcriptional LysR family regulator
MIASASTIRKRLRLRHLQLMVALSETGSLRRAADELAMTQPAATKALQELEDTVGVSLFVRHARGMEPTIFGEAVMRYARVVFEDLDELREELAAIEAGDIGKVRIGAVMAPAPELLTQAIVSLKAAHPRLQKRLYRLSLGRIILPRRPPCGPSLRNWRNIRGSCSRIRARCARLSTRPFASHA